MENSIQDTFYYDTNNNEVLLSDYIWNTATTAWKIDQGVSFTYNAANKATQTVTQRGSPLSNYTKDINTYDANNNLTLSTGLIWDHTRLRWAVLYDYNGGTSTVAYTYAAANKIASNCQNQGHQLY